MRWDKVAVKLFLICVMAGGVVISLSRTATATDDPRFRYDNTFTKTINRDWSISLYSEFDTYNFNDLKTNHNQYDLNAIDNELTVNYSRVAPWLDLGGGIGYWDAKIDGSWEGTTFPFVYATFKKTMFGLEFSDRNRIDCEFPEHGAEGPVYRNYAVIATVKTWTSLEIQPFVANENFYAFQARYDSDNQAWVGFNFKVTKNVRASLALMMDISHVREADGDHWKKTPIVVLSTAVNF